MSTAKAEKEGLALIEIVTSAAVLALVTVIVVIALQILYFAMLDEEVERKTVTPVEFANLAAEQKALLQGGTGGLTIDEAMTAVIRKYGEETAAP